MRHWRQGTQRITKILYRTLTSENTLNVITSPGLSLPMTRSTEKTCDQFLYPVSTWPKISRWQHIPTTVLLFKLVLIYLSLCSLMSLRPPGGSGARNALLLSTMGHNNSGPRIFRPCYDRNQKALPPNINNASFSGTTRCART